MQHKMTKFMSRIKSRPNRASFVIRKQYIRPLVYVRPDRHAVHFEAAELFFYHNTAGRFDRGNEVFNGAPTKLIEGTAILRDALDDLIVYIGQRCEITIRNRNVSEIDPLLEIFRNNFSPT